MQAAIEATKAEIMAIREADNPVNSARPIHTTARLDSLAWRQPTFYWKMRDKYQELCNFETEVKNIFEHYLQYARKQEGPSNTQLARLREAQICADFK